VLNNIGYGCWVSSFPILLLVAFSFEFLPNIGSIMRLYQRVIGVCSMVAVGWAKTWCFVFLLALSG